MAVAEYRVFFEGAFYKIVGDEEAEVLLYEGKPIAAACLEHGPHAEIFGCPHVEKLLKKIFS